jgi:hypothetical protein
MVIIVVAATVVAERDEVILLLRTTILKQCAKLSAVIYITIVSDASFLQML